MRTLIVLLVGLTLAACNAQLLPTTVFHAAMVPDQPASETDWLRLARAREPGAELLAALAPIEAGDFLVWTRDGRDRGLLVRARRTVLGLEAQSAGTHAGPAVRPTVRALVVDGARVFVVESSSAADSTDRDAWLYAERGHEIVPMSLDGRVARLSVRAVRRTPLERGWSRAATLTVTLESGPGCIVVHEHESVRELAEGRPELSPRGTYEVERARTLRLEAATLTSDRPSLFDDES